MEERVKRSGVAISIKQRTIMDRIIHQRTNTLAKVDP